MHAFPHKFSFFVFRDDRIRVMHENTKSEGNKNIHVNLGLTSNETVNNSVVLVSFKFYVFSSKYLNIIFYCSLKLLA